MKPDGTLTVAEFAKMAKSQLQSWELEELADMLIDRSAMIEYVRTLSAEELSDITDYCVYEDYEDCHEESDLENASISDIAEALIEKLSFESIHIDEYRELKDALKYASVDKL